jgi:hypothetical protein
MRLEPVYFTSLLFTALSLAPGLAHLFALPNKIHLDANDYLTVQQIYRGWALLGILLILALVSNLVLTILTRNGKPYFMLNGTAFVCILLNLIIFFAFTFPANWQTNNWTMLPENWKQLRVQWEYSHAINACLSFIAFIVLIISVVKGMTGRLTININH